MKHTIYPYTTIWNTRRVWVFDDKEAGLESQGMVSGTDRLLDAYIAKLPIGADEGIAFTFSDEPFEGGSIILDYLGPGVGKDFATGCKGNWFQDRDTHKYCWMCPALFRFFGRIPNELYISISPSPSTPHPIEIDRFVVALDENYEKIYSLREEV